jgi:hypothetical protein
MRPHCGEVRLFRPQSMLATTAWQSIGASPHLQSIKCPTPTACFPFLTPDYLVLLQASKFLLCGTLLLLLCIYLLLVVLGLLCNAIGRFPLMAQLNSARNFFERARIKGSGSNKDTVNGEEVKKELSDSTKRGCRRSLALWYQWVNRSAPQERTGVLTVLFWRQVSGGSPQSVSRKHRSLKGFL